MLQRLLVVLLICCSIIVSIRLTSGYDINLFDQEDEDEEDLITSTSIRPQSSLPAFYFLSRRLNNLSHSVNAKTTLAAATAATTSTLVHKFRGEGTYACAFSPAFPCKEIIANYSSTDALSAVKTIGKVFVDDPDEFYGPVEWQRAAALRSIGFDPLHQVVYYPYASCFVDAMSVYRASKSQCSAFDQARIDLIEHKDTSKPALTRFEQLIQPDGEITFASWVKTSGRHARGTVRRADLVLQLENLFSAVQQLLAFRLVHQDIKLENIVVPLASTTNTDAATVEGNRTIMKPPSPKLIDIGVMSSFEEFYDRNNNTMFGLSDYYTTHPVEYRLLFYRNHPDKAREKNLTSPNPLTGHVDFLREEAQLYSSDRKIKLFDRLFLQNPVVLSQFKEFFWAFHNPAFVRGQQFVRFLKKQSIHLKSDVWALGTVLFYLESYLLSREEAVAAAGQGRGDDPRAVELFEKLVTGMMHPSPVHRFSIEQAKLVMKQLVALGKW